MTWLGLYASNVVSASFYLLGFAVPLCFRAGLFFNGESSVRKLNLQGWVILVARDASVTGVACVLALVLEQVAPYLTHFVLVAAFALSVALSCVDVMLLGEIGTRVELEVLGYASELNVIGGARWHRPAYATAGLVVASLAIEWWATRIVAPVPVVALVALGAGCVPLLMWHGGSTNESFWRLDSVLWRWAQMGLQAVRPRVIRRQVESTTPQGICIPPREQYTSHHPSYPLWRNTHVWGSPRALSWSMPKGHTPHVIYVVMESMGAMDTGCIGQKANQTPCFDAWSRRGLLFTRHYAPGHSTSRSMMSALYGVLPGHRARPTLESEHPAYLHGLPQIFADQGYETLYLQGAPLLFDDKASFFSRRGFAHVQGADWILEQYPKAELGAWNSPHDAYMFEAHLNWLKEKRAARMPTFSTLLTISNHGPWDVPEAWRWAEIQSESAYRKNMESSDPKVTRHRSNVTLAYADAQLGMYLDRLQAEGILDDAIVLVSGDTGQQYEAGQVNTQIGGYLRDVSYHIPMLILAPNFFGESKRFAHVTSQIDVVPTLLDMMGLAGPHHSMGQSLLRLPQREAVHFTQPHQPAFFGLRQDHWRFNVSVDGSWTSLYELSSDPDETHNMASAQVTLAHTFKEEAARVQDVTTRLHQQDAFCPPADGVATKQLMQLAQARRKFAPAGLMIPQTQEAVQAIVDHPPYAQIETMRRFQHFAMRILRSQLVPEKQLKFLKLRLQHLYPDTFGELDYIDEVLVIDLHNELEASERLQEADVLAQARAALARGAKFKL